MEHPENLQDLHEVELKQFVIQLRKFANDLEEHANRLKHYVDSLEKYSTHLPQSESPLHTHTVSHSV